MGEKQLRCKDCKWLAKLAGWYCSSVWLGLRETVNPGQFACKKFVYKDK